MLNLIYAWVQEGRSTKEREEVDYLLNATPREIQKDERRKRWSVAARLGEVAK